MTGFRPHAFTLRQVQYALAVAEFGGFRAAAEACHVAQPSLSAQVASLEEALGVQLFERRTRKILTTAAGAPILERFRALMRAAEDVQATADAVQDPFAQPLHLGILPTIAPYLLAGAAPALRSAFPKLTATWTEGTTEALVAAVVAGSLDGAVVAEEADLAPLARVPIAKDRFVLAMASGDPLASGRRPLPLEAIDGRTVLVLADGHCLGDQAISACQRVGGIPASFRATSLATLLGMVEAGGGLTLLPSIAAATEGRRTGIVLRPFHGKGPSRTLVLVHRAAAPRTAVLAAIAKVLRGLVSGV